MVSCPTYIKNLEWYLLFKYTLFYISTSCITEVTGIVVHGKKNIKTAELIFSNFHIQLKNCNFETFCFLTYKLVSETRDDM